jgi:hypothetical protein
VLLAALIWLPTTGLFSTIREAPGVTSGGGNTLHEAIRGLSISKTDPVFRRYVMIRIWLHSVAVAVRSYVLLAQARAGDALAGLGMLIVAGAIAGSFRAPL